MAVIIEDETLQMYIEESKEHLEDIETDLLEIERQGENVDDDLINKVFRAAHSIKGGAGFLNLTTTKELSHKIENVLDMVRNGQMIPTSDIVNTILVAFDRLGELLDNVLDSNEMEISEHIIALTSLATSSLPAIRARASTTSRLKVSVDSSCSIASKSAWPGVFSFKSPVSICTPRIPNWPLSPSR